jgi:hypothetical protein
MTEYQNPVSRKVTHIKSHGRNVDGTSVLRSDHIRGCISDLGLIYVGVKDNSRVNKLGSIVYVYVSD